MFSAVAFGASLGSLAVTYSVVHSTLAAPPSRGLGARAHLRIIAVRLLFFALATSSITLVRPLRLAIGDNLLAPVLGLMALFIVLIAGMKFVAPRFVRIRLTS